MRKNALVLLVVMLLVGCKPAPPAQFTSARFEFVYMVTPGLRFADADELKLKGGDNDHEAFLFAARQGLEQSGFVAIAEKLGPYTSLADGAAHAGTADGPSFLEMVGKSYKKDPNYKETGRTHVVEASGFVFDELDYRYGEEYDAAVVTPVGEGYLLVARCNAGSAGELTRLTDSLHGLRRLK